MKLAFYYHIPIIEKSGKLLIPSYLGVFLASLSSQVSHLNLIMHEASGNDIIACDFELINDNVTWHNLGLKSPAWHRAIFHNKILKNTLKKIYSVDVLLIRSPSPLAPYFYKYFPREKICFMIVGDYNESVKNSKLKNFKSIIIFFYIIFNNWLFKRQIRKTKTLVNSQDLFNKYQYLAFKIDQIKTTTLSKNDFFERYNTCQNNVINLIFTGRIDLHKGLVELVTATAYLIKRNRNVVCNIVGWESNPNKPVQKELFLLAKLLNIEKQLIFLVRQSVGAMLNSKYRMADIFVLPSYHEGFPRTIWEAMANSLPVITTPVGSIPKTLTVEENVLLVKPKESVKLANEIERILDDTTLRKKLIKNGYILALENTLENQTAKLITKLKDE